MTRGARRIDRRPGEIDGLIATAAAHHAGGRHKVAAKFFRQALSLFPDDPIANDGIATAYQALGRKAEALEHFSRSITLSPAGAESSAKQRPAIAAALKRLADAWPRQLPLAEQIGDQGHGALADEMLLLALLRSKIISDLDLERLLTGIRRALVQCVTAGNPPDSDVLPLFAALAQQCFLNDYAFALEDTEQAQAQDIHDRVANAIASGSEIAPLDLVVAASYRPLHRLPRAAALLQRSWPDALTPLLTLQISEPLEEAADRAHIPVLTPVDDAVSLQVRQQYEENPYPRWISLPPIKPTTLADYIGDKTGMALKDRPSGSEQLDVLIAGCGTGAHSLDTAQRFPGSRVLAVDISRVSLAYARRKSRERGLTNIDYGQADILKLGALDRRFDLIEVVGVLHHLGDPEAGWRVLVSLLKPNGLMIVGLYSELARRGVVSARDFIAGRGYRATADGIRACRQDMIRLGKAPRSDDFFSISGCRDLFFHVMEHRFTIPRIAAFLDANELRFLGFQAPGDVIEKFRQRYQDPAALSDLGCWHTFEEAHPYVFSGMYYFWVQKRS